MAEPQEKIGLEITVNDRGTPVVRRHTEETKRALSEVETASKRSGAATSGAMEGAGKATGSLVRGMEKAQVAAIALSGGLQGAGAQVARFSSAIGHLALTGFTPLALAITGAATALGLLISKHGEAAEAAKKHREEEERFSDILVRNAREVRYARLGVTPSAMDTARDDLAKVEARIGRLREQGTIAAAGGGTSWRPEPIPGMSAKEAAEKLIPLLEEQRALKAELAKLEAIQTAESLRRIRAEAADYGLQGMRAADAARWAARDAQRLSGAAATEAALSDFARSARGAQGGFFRDVTPALSWGDGLARARVRGPYDIPEPFPSGLNPGGLSPLDEAVEAARRERVERMENRMPFEAPAPRVDPVAADRTRDLEGIGRSSGTRIAMGFNEGVSRFLTSGKFDFKQLADTIRQSIQDAIIAGLTRATFQKPLEDALASAIGSIGGSASGPAPLTVMVPQPKVTVSSGEVFAAASERESRAFVMSAVSGPSVRGRRE